MLKNLKDHLDKKGISIRAFATFLEISETSVQNKIRGRTSFTYPEARKIKQFLFPEYDMDYLFEVEDDTPDQQVS